MELDPPVSVSPIPFSVMRNTISSEFRVQEEKIMIKLSLCFARKTTLPSFIFLTGIGNRLPEDFLLFSTEIFNRPCETTAIYVEGTDDSQFIASP